jgi:hypothetical protein
MTETRKEREGWEVVDKLVAGWSTDQFGLTLTVEVLKKQDQYRLAFSQPGNMTEDVFVELTGEPKKLENLEDLSHKKYVELLGAEDYGGWNLDGILAILEVESTSEFEKSNIWGEETSE